MKPGMDQLLVGAATALATRILPEVRPGSYAEGDIKMIAVILILLAQEAGRAQGRAVREIGEMQGLLERAAGLGWESTTFAPLPDDLNAIQAEHDRLATLMIKAHEYVEAREDEAARALDRDIWAWLGRYAGSRALLLPDV